MFLNQLLTLKGAVRGEATQTCLRNILNVMEGMSDELAESVKPEEDGVTKEQVKEVIDRRQLVEWNLETAKKIIKNGVQPQKETPTSKSTTADL